MPTDRLAAAAIEGIRSGMLVGLGTGRAAARGVRALAERARRERLDLTCVATSQATAELAVGLGLRVVDFSAVERVDYLFDGADEVDPSLNMLKGGGGAMTRERIVAAAAVTRVNIIDEQKLVSRLGERMPLPVEVIPMARASVSVRLGALGLHGKVRRHADQAVDAVTDNGNLIVDVALPARAPGWSSIEELTIILDATAGIVDHGLFLDEAQAVLVETSDGRVERRDRARP